MARRSTKTDRVLNLITAKNTEEITQTSTAEPEIPKIDEEVVLDRINPEILVPKENKIKPPKSKPLPKIDKEAELSSAILSALETQLNKDFNNLSVDENFAASNDFVPVSDKEEMARNIISPNNISDMKESPMITEKTTYQTTPSEQNIEYDYINVMEKIIQDKALDYMNKFEMCTCQRCVVDVMAISLSKLTPKYIVSVKGSNFPMLNYYSQKFSVEVASNLTKACMIVQNNPNHK